MPARISNSYEEADAGTFKKELEYWQSAIRGAEIICHSYEKAVNLRYRMYKIRKKLQTRDGQTPYDDLVIKLPDQGRKLIIGPRDTGVIEVIPLNLSDEELGINPVDTEEAMRERFKEYAKRKPLITEEQSGTE